MLNALYGKTILVTGANGFIGKHLISRLLTLSNVSVITLSRQKLIAQTPALKRVESELHKLDAVCWQQNNVTHIDVIIHLGAFTPKAAADANNFDEIYKSNITGTYQLLKSLPNIPEKILFASSLDVYAKPVSNNFCLKEAQPPCPATFYGSSKLFGEKMIESYAAQTKTTHAILRYGHIYGPGEMAYKKFIPEIIRKLIRDEQPTLQGDGTSVRDFLYVEDAIEATMRAICKPETLPPTNIVSGHSHSLLEIFNTLKDIAKSSMLPIFLAEKANDLTFFYDNQLMWERLGRWSLTSLQDGLQSEYEDFRRYYQTH